MSNGSGLFATQYPVQGRFAVPGSAGPGGEIADLRGDVARVLAPLVAITIDEFSHPTAALPAALEALHISNVGARTVTSFLAPGTVILATYPRNVTITLDGGGTPGHSFTSALITGRDINSIVMTETITINPASPGLYSGVKCFHSISSIAYAGGTGIAASLSIGFGTKIGLTKSIKVHNTKLVLVREMIGGYDITNGIHRQAMTVAAKAANALKIATAIPGVGSSLVPGGMAQPDFPRNVTLTTVNDAGAAFAGNATVIGTDAWGNVLSELIALGGGPGLKTGLSVFATVTSVAIPAQPTPPWTGNGTISIGTGDVVGVQAPTFVGLLLQEVIAGTVVATGSTTALATNPPLGAYAPAAPPAATAYQLFYAVNGCGTLQDATTAPPHGAYIPGIVAVANGVYTIEYEYTP